MSKRATQNGVAMTSFHLRLPVELLERLRQRASDLTAGAPPPYSGVSINQLAVGILDQALQAEDADAPEGKKSTS